MKDFEDDFVDSRRSLPPKDSIGGGNDDGVALALAISGALVVSITAAVLLNFTYRRFQLSMRQADRMTAFYASEAGTQYAWVRLSRDIGPGTPPTSLAAAIAADDANTAPPTRPYIISSYATDEDARAAGHISNSETIDPFESNIQILRINNRNVTVRITLLPGGQYQVTAMSDYQT